LLNPLFYLIFSGLQSLKSASLVLKQAYNDGVLQQNRFTTLLIGHICNIFNVNPNNLSNKPAKVLIIYFLQSITYTFVKLCKTFNYVVISRYN
ncbi:MAG: hypothetical protein KAR20_00835, partial [Candidatus Heimdallarchaeota archaeon]|nr:hypothetical protein [Candidatus Heimdallarchaeota archaeon]